MNKHKIIVKTSKPVAGFTIIELLIATAVFSTVLLLSLTGFLQIGQLFYRGISATQTNSVARAVFDSLKSDIIYDTSSTAIAPVQSSSYSGISRWYFCAGTNRYTYIQLQKLDASQEATEMKYYPVVQWHQFGMLKDTIATGCPDPFGTGPGSVPISVTTATELLSDKSRLLTDNTKPIISLLAIPGTKLYNLDVRIAYGEDSVLSSTTNPNAQCVGNAAATQFCFTAELKTTVRRGF